MAKPSNKDSTAAGITTLILFLFIAGCFYKMCNTESNNSSQKAFSVMTIEEKEVFLNSWNDGNSDSRSNIQGQILRQEKACLQYPETYKFIDHTFSILSADSGSVMITEKFTGSNGFGVPVGFFAFAFCTISADSATLYQFICYPENEVTN